jgi:hypothetical protein
MRDCVVMVSCPISCARIKGAVADRVQAEGQRLANRPCTVLQALAGFSRARHHLVAER